MKTSHNSNSFLLVKVVIVFIVMLAPSKKLLSQDSSLVYFDKGWQECDKDTAFYYSKTYKQDDFWAEKYFWVSGNKLYREGKYNDKECKIGQGPFTLFRQDGTVKSTTVYDHGKRLTADYFYESGKKKAHITYNSNGVEQEGWDENGEEVPGYIVEREAMFPGGMNGWKAYLEKHLEPNVAAWAHAPAGLYPVKVTFIVDKEGNVSNVKAIEVPTACQPCGKEAVKVILKGPKWLPAIQDNKPVIYQAFQYISWQVAN